MEYLPLLKTLRGHAAMLEVGDATRPSVEVLRGIVWDVFFENKILLMIVFEDRSVEKAGAPTPAGSPPKAKEFETVREFNFKWIRVGNIITVLTDAAVTVNRNQRTMKKAKTEPLYTDEPPQWSVINNHLCRQIIGQLRALGLTCEFTGGFKNETPDAITFEEAFAPPPQPAAAQPAPAVSQTPVAPAAPAATF